MARVYQFKITLNVKPKVWRTIQVPENFTFKDLHRAIQISMGWESADIMYHMHKFEIGKDSIGPDPDGFLITIDQNTAKIADYFHPSKHMQAKYLYDFGEDWDHKVTLESITPAVAGVTYPRCINGKNACPPEDGVYHGSGKRSNHFDPKSVNFESKFYNLAESSDEDSESDDEE